MDNFKRTNSLEDVLEMHLEQWEEEYGIAPGAKSLAGRFQQLIGYAVKKTGKDVVILVDEYDKPLLEQSEDDKLGQNRDVFKGFFNTLKSYDRYIAFIFLTGVTKFNKVNIFSDLNQLIDISLSLPYSGICGISEAELKESFMPEIRAMAAVQGMSLADCLEGLKKMYDGYHFHQDSEGMYNPFSLLNALREKEFGMYWFATGTPTFLIRKLKESGFDAKHFSNDDYFEEEASLTDYRTDNEDPVPLFYQTGYLTIKAYDREFRSYALGYPNEEVRYGFLKTLAPYYLFAEREPRPLDIRSFVKDIREG